LQKKAIWKSGLLHGDNLALEPRVLAMKFQLFQGN